MDAMLVKFLLLLLGHVRVISEVLGRAGMFLETEDRLVPIDLNMIQTYLLQLVMMMEGSMAGTILRRRLLIGGVQVRIRRLLSRQLAGLLVEEIGVMGPILPVVVIIPLRKTLITINLEEDGMGHHLPLVTESDMTVTIHLKILVGMLVQSGTSSAEVSTTIVTLIICT